MQVKIRETIKITDKDHHMFEWYEDRGQGEAKTMEIAYTRSGKK
jgi:ABC-type tungstate transport system permease subunit